MRRILLRTLSMFIAIAAMIGVGSNIVYATGGINKSYNHEISQIEVNSMMIIKNEKLENSTLITESYLDEVKKTSDVIWKKIDEQKVEITVNNREPDKTIYYMDGTSVDVYSSSIIVGNFAETYKTVDVEIYVRMEYSRYEWNQANYFRLDNGYGKLVNCWEQAYRNLVISNAVYGGWRDLDGTEGYLVSMLKNSRTIASPTKGALYSQASPSSHFMAIDTSNGNLATKVSIEWQHGSWYTTSWNINKGTYSLF